jgi:hypothetical protein
MAQDASQDKSPGEEKGIEGIRSVASYIKTSSLI